MDFGFIWTLHGFVCRLWTTSSECWFSWFLSTWGRVFEDLIIIVRIRQCLKINLTYSVLFRFFISSQDSMDGPLKISQVILGTLKSDTQALQITSMEPSLYTTFSKNSNAYF